MAWRTGGNHYFSQARRSKEVEEDRDLVTRKVGEEQQREEQRLRKKLREIETLERKQEAGEKLEPNQLKKISTKETIVQELEACSAGAADANDAALGATAASSASTVAAVKGKGKGRGASGGQAPTIGSRLLRPSLPLQKHRGYSSPAASPPSSHPASQTTSPIPDEASCGAFDQSTDGDGGGGADAGPLPGPTQPTNLSWADRARASAAQSPQTAPARLGGPPTVDAQATSKSRSSVQTSSCIDVHRFCLPGAVPEAQLWQLKSDLEHWQQRFLGASVKLSSSKRRGERGGARGGGGGGEGGGDQSLVVELPAQADFDAEAALQELRALALYDLGLPLSTPRSPSSASSSPSPSGKVAPTPIDDDLDDDLSNPSTVFRCCDTDRSLGLDCHELRFALNAFGLFPTMDYIQEWMEEQPCVDEATFRSLLEKKSRSAPTWMRGPRAIPYARRGVSLEQLDRLNDAFVTSGWIQERCDKFNRDNEESIRAKQVFALEPNLYALDRFVIVPVTCPASEAASERDSRSKIPCELLERAELPEATHKSSYSELVNPNGIRVDVFVSHFWGHPFGETMNALHRWSRQSHQQFGRPRAEDMVFWLCFLALNQHRKGEEVGSSPEEGPFNAALMQSRAAVMILDESVNPFQRIWCLFEVKRLTDLKKHFELICSFGSVASLLDESVESCCGEQGSFSGQREEVVDCAHKIGDALQEVSAFRAQASSEEDRLAIWHRVADPAFRRLSLDRAKHRFTMNAFKRFDMTMRSLLALPLFQASMRGGDYQKALCYLGLGAAFGPQDLDILETASIDVAHCEVLVQSAGQKSVCWTLLHCACFFGHLEAARSLLDRKADLEHHTTYGLAALHHATRNGHVEISSFLLECRAELVSKAGVHALGAAAHQGYDRVVELLLKARANPNAASRGMARGGTKGLDRPLNVAASQGHHEVVEVLLRHRADVCANTCPRDGITALHAACQDNHANVVEVLLQAQPEVLRRKTRRGHSAIDLAEASGHTELADTLRGRLQSMPALAGGGDDVDLFADGDHLDDLPDAWPGHGHGRSPGQGESPSAVSPHPGASGFSPTRSHSHSHSHPGTPGPGQAMSPSPSNSRSPFTSDASASGRPRRFTYMSKGSGSSYLGSSDHTGNSASTKPAKTKRHW